MKGVYGRGKELDLPKVEVASIEMSCHFDIVETLIVIISPTLLLLSLFCTSMPPGLSSHSISQFSLQSFSIGDATTLLPKPSLDMLLQNLFDLNFIILFSFSFSHNIAFMFSLEELKVEKLVREFMWLGTYILLESIMKCGKL